MDQTFIKDRLRLLLDHFSTVGDPREACKVKYPLPEVLFLVTCATIAGCDDYDEIADWADDHQDFLKSYGEYFFGTPKEDWLRVVLNRIDPALFEACFTSWALSLRADAPDLIALDGKTVRRSGDEAAGCKPIHLVSAWAARAIRNHWGIESLHWVLDVIFKEDQSRLRRGHGAANMALVRRLAFNMVRAGKGKRSIKTARKAAGWKTNNLKAIINQPR